MKQTAILLVLLTLCFFVKAQIPTVKQNPRLSDSILQSQNLQRISEEERKIMMKMVRLENNSLIAQPGFAFEKINENTVALKPKNSVTKTIGRYKCMCEVGSSQNDDCKAIRENERNLICKGSTCSNCHFLFFSGDSNNGKIIY